MIGTGCLKLFENHPTFFQTLTVVKSPLRNSLGVVFPHRNFFPWGMGKNGEGKFFSHGEMGKNGESYFGFKLTKNGIKSTLFEFRAYFLAS